MENVRKHRDVKLVTTEPRGNYSNRIIIQQSFYQKPISIEMRKIQILMNKPVYLGLSILETSKIAMYEFWYDYVNSRCDKKQSCYIDRDNFIVYIKAKNFNEDVAKDA